jgi:cytochrome c biogenesis protein CcdA
MTYPFLFIFSAGMVAAFNPCGIAMLPSFITYLIGSDGTQQSLFRSIVKGLWLGVSMTAGFLTIFVIAGFLLTVLGRTLIYVFPILSFIMGILIILLGLGMLVGKKVSLPLGSFDVKPGKWSVYFYGMAYAITSLSCTLPAFLFVITESIQGHSSILILLKFTVYAVGMGIVVTVICIGSLISKQYAQRFLRNNMGIIQYLSAIIITVSGIYISYYWGFGPSGLFQ